MEGPLLTAKCKIADSNNLEVVEKAHFSVS